MTHLEPDHVRYELTSDVIDHTELLLVEPGCEGFEGSVVWVGKQQDSRNAIVTHAHRPEQISHASALGLSVEVTEAGLSDLIAGLQPGETVLGRIHTHGNDDTDHSPMDDANLIVAHPGAFSIIVPFFASGGIHLRACGVHLLGSDHRWRRLPADEIDARFTLL